MEQSDKRTSTVTSSSTSSSSGARATTASAASTSTKIQDGATSPPYEEVKVYYATEQQLRSVFSNALITDILLESLTFADMKAAREVSRDFCKMIEGNKRFNENAVLRVTEETFNYPKILSNWNRTWRGIKVDMSLPRDKLQTIPRHILQNVQFVSLVSYPENFPRRKAVAPLCIRDILEWTSSKMCHLQLDMHLLETNLETLFTSFDDSPVGKNLRDLKRFDILSGLLTSTSVRIHAYGHILKMCGENFLHFAKALQRLESFRMPTRMQLYDRQKQPSIESKIVELLQKNRETLRKLSFSFQIWENDAIRAVTLPFLNSLTVAVGLCGQTRLKDFVANHPFLEELDLAILSGFEIDLFEMIKERSANLKKLHLEMKPFDAQGQEPRLDWSFLGTMTRLKDFKLSVNEYEYPENWRMLGNGTRLLQSLPRNQLERLSLRGIDLKDTGFYLYNDRDTEPELPVSLEILRGFRNLKRLSLRCCLNAVNDDIMQFIIREMTSLEEFEVSHCFYLTDTGIAGTSEDGSDSIRNLKHLKKLSILRCRLVTPEGILSCVKFPYLRHLEYFTKTTKVPKSVVLEIACQNPSLESLAINWDSPEESAAEKLKEVKNTRLTKLIYLTARKVDCRSGSDSDFETDADDDDDSSDEERVYNEPWRLF